MLEEAVAKYGKLASMLTDHASPFYDNVSEMEGASVYEKNLADLDIRRVLARVMRPRANGKLERFGELQ